MIYLFIFWVIQKCKKYRLTTITPHYCICIVKSVSAIAIFFVNIYKRFFLGRIFMYPDKHYQNSLWTLIEKKKNSYKIINNPSKENPPKQNDT